MAGGRRVAAHLRVLRAGTLISAPATSGSACKRHQQRDDSNDQEQEEQDLGDAGCAGGNAAKAEQCRDQCDYEKTR
jgi:hypothetical protein